MSKRIDWENVDAAAKAVAGNWQKFELFAPGEWAYEVAGADKWAILYTHNRDSGLLDQANGKVIREALEPFTEGDDTDVVASSASHWAVGWIAGFRIRVLRDGQPTAAFQKYAQLQAKMADYPVLNVSLYSEMESEATYENVQYSISKLLRRDKIRRIDETTAENEWTANAAGEAIRWFDRNNSGALESGAEDQGAYPDDDELIEALIGCGLVTTVDEEEGA